MAQQPDDIIVIQRILKLLKENYQNIGDTLISGGLTIWRNTSTC
jgi:hypothetical protein